MTNLSGDFDGDRIRVATLNLFGVRADWPRRREVLRAGFAELSPDLVSLQEAIKTTDYDQARDVLGEEYHLAHHGVRLADGQGDSIASRWPIAAVRQLDVPSRQPATAPLSSTLLVKIDAPAPIGAVLLVANHATAFELDPKPTANTKPSSSPAYSNTKSPAGGYTSSWPAISMPIRTPPASDTGLALNLSTEQACATATPGPRCTQTSPGTPSPRKTA
jgi:hypothetical protein